MISLVLPLGWLPILNDWQAVHLDYYNSIKIINIEEWLKNGWFCDLERINKCFSQKNKINKRFSRFVHVPHVWFVFYSFNCYFNPLLMYDSDYWRDIISAKSLFSYCNWFNSVFRPFSRKPYYR